MLELTQSARDHLVQARTTRGVGDRAGARFSSRDGKVGLTFTTSPARTDTVVEADGIEVFLAAEVAERLSDGVIDTRQDGGNEVLVLLGRARSLNL